MTAVGWSRLALVASLASVAANLCASHNVSAAFGLFTVFAAFFTWVGATGDAARARARGRSRVERLGKP